MDAQEIPVLVVGGSLVGLSTSLFLSRQGVDHLVVERHPGTAVHPRAAFLLQRTVETFRTAGIQDEGSRGGRARVRAEWRDHVGRVARWP